MLSRFVGFLSFLLAISGALSDDCSNMKACSAKCGAQSYDVSGILDKISIVSDNYTFVFSCKGTVCNERPNTMICQKKNDGREWSVGLTNTSSWSVVRKNPIQLMIKYGQGDGENGKIRSSDVSITVNRNQSKFVGEDKNTATYEFSIFTKSNSDFYPSGHKIPPGIIGWAVIAVALIGFLAYLVIGSIVMFQMKGARGLEIIPNYTFWRYFPFLLADGVYLFVCSSVADELPVRCTEEKACSAICDGKKIDVTHYYRELVVKGDSRGWNYIFSCTGEPCGADKLNTTAVCQQRGAESYSCGSTNHSVWTLVSTDPLSLNISYFGDASNSRASYINLTIDSDAEEESPYAFTGEKGGFYTFQFIVKPYHKSGPTEGYIGWILIGLSLIGFLLYFLIGMVSLRFIKGARGLEIIPNLYFWKSFPFLIKDGVLFTISPCLRRTGYDRV